jgi:septal ring factor EnvC (AmiA/AmiB activator)
MGLINITCPVCKQAHQRVYGNLDPRCYRCKWSAASVAPVNLMELNKRMSERLREADERAANLQDRFNSQYDRIKDLERDYADASARADERTQQVDKLQQEVDELKIRDKVLGDTIDWLSKRLRNARRQLWNVVFASGMSTASVERDASLDP